MDLTVDSVDGFFGRALSRAAEPLGLMKEPYDAGVRYEGKLLKHVLEQPDYLVALNFPTMMVFTTLLQVDASELIGPATPADPSVATSAPDLNCVPNSSSQQSEFGSDTRSSSSAPTPVQKQRIREGTLGDNFLFAMGLRPEQIFRAYRRFDIDKERVRETVYSHIKELYERSSNPYMKRERDIIAKDVPRYVKCLADAKYFFLEDGGDQGAAMSRLNAMLEERVAQMKDVSIDEIFSA